jgi:hypothetical protein
MSRNIYYSDLHNDNAMRHYGARAVGQLTAGPFQTRGYDNKVIQLTMNEIDFKSSIDANRYIDQVRRKYDNKDGLCRSRRLKLASINSD